MGAKESLPEKKIVLLGKTGDGKSSSGNTILGQQIFIPKASPTSETTECLSGNKMFNRRKITVIDTPGFFDTGCDEKNTKSAIIQCLLECAPGPDVFTIVLKVGRYTAQEMEIIKKIAKCFGKNTFKHSVILFTHGEQLEGQTIENFVKQSPKLQELVDNCGGRCHVIDNKYWDKRSRGYKSNRVQVKKLIKTIEKMVKDIKDEDTNELFQTLEKEIQKEMKKITEDNLSPEKKREIAKKTLHKKLLIRFAALTVGTLTGAFLGVGVAVAAVVALLKAVGISKSAKEGTLAGAATAAGATGIKGKTLAVEVGVAAGAGIGAASSGIAAGVLVGAAALAGAIGGGVTGYKVADEEDSVHGAIQNAAKANYENAKDVVKKIKKQDFKLFNKEEKKEEKNEEKKTEKK